MNETRARAGAVEASFAARLAGALIVGAHAYDDDEAYRTLYMIANASAEGAISNDDGARAAALFLAHYERELEAHRATCAPCKARLAPRKLN